MYQSVLPFFVVDFFVVVCYYLFTVMVAVWR